MDFTAIAKSIGAQFATAWNAPVPFLAAVIAVWLVIRWHFRTAYEQRLANAASTEKLLERQLQEYKDKTGSETPDAVKTRIDALEQRIGELAPQVAAMGPRKVSAEQRQLMVPLLDPFRGQSINIASDAASADAAQMSKGLVAAFNSAGWITQTSMVMGLGNPPTSGVGVRIENPNEPTASQNAVISALRSAGIAFDLQRGSILDLPPHAPLHLQRPASVAEIILTNRLED